MVLTLTRRLALLALLLLPGGCAGLIGQVENPRISVTSLKVLPASGVEQRIEVGLRVLNPNSFDLLAKGIVINIGLNDIPLMTGAASGLPVVPAYGEADMNVTLSVSLVSGIRLVSALMRRPDQPLQYRLEARLDLSRPFGKRLTLMEQGEISPRPPSKATDTETSL